MEWHEETKVRLRLRGRGRLGWNEGQNRRDNENVNQCDLEKEESAETHKLVIAELGKGLSDPHKKEKDDGDLCEEDSDVDQSEDPTV